MTQVHIALARVSGRALTGSTMPVPDTTPLAAATVTATSVSAQVAGVAAPDGDCFWSVTVSGGAVEAAFGAGPEAGEDAGWLILDGQTRDFAAGAAGEKIAVKAA
jgi:hypothetical protein